MTLTKLNFMVVDLSANQTLIAGLSMEDAILHCQELITAFPYRSFMTAVDRRDAAEQMSNQPVNSREWGVGRTIEECWASQDAREAAHFNRPKANSARA